MRYIFKHIFFLILVTLVTNNLKAQENELPVENEIIKEVLGDLDKDSIDEKVVVCNIHKIDVTNLASDRVLYIYKKIDSSWVLWNKSYEAILSSNEGGIYGDPFEDIEINSGILYIYHRGGSSWKWSYTDKYRYQNNTFELIGISEEGGKNCEYWLKTDYNISTGKIIIIKEYEKCIDDMHFSNKTKKEIFYHKLKKKITLKDRRDKQPKIVSPRFKFDIYISNQ